MTIETTDRQPLTERPDVADTSTSERATESAEKSKQTDPIVVIPRTTLNYALIAVVCLAVGLVVGITITSKDASGLTLEMVSTAVARSMSESGSRAAAPSGPAPVVNVSTDDDPAWGPQDAPVTIIEFSDFQCPYCARFHQETYKQIRQNYEGKIRFVYRDFPIVQLHPYAEISAEAAECVNEQGKFWEFHDLLLTNQNITSIDDVNRFAAQLGTNMDSYNECMDAHRYQQEVAKDIQDGTSYGVQGTPTFFINGQPVVGAQPYSVFASVIDAQLAKVSQGESTVAPAS